MRMFLAVMCAVLLGLPLAISPAPAATRTSSPAPTPTPTPTSRSAITAMLLGQTGEDVVGTVTQTHDGVKDVHIKLTGVSGAIKGVRITGPSLDGVWEAPFNGKNWIVAIRPQSDPSIVDLYFDFYKPITSYALTVTFSDGTTQGIQAIQAISAMASPSLMPTPAPEQVPKPAPAPTPPSITTPAAMPPTGMASASTGTAQAPTRSVSAKGTTPPAPTTIAPAPTPPNSTAPATSTPPKSGAVTMASKPVPSPAPAPTAPSSTTPATCTPLVPGAGQIGDLAIHPAPPAPPLPGAGGKFNDPTYCTQILRVTDRNDGDQAGHSYSLWSPFNYNSTRLLIAVTPTPGSNSVWMLYDFDPVNFTSKKVGPVEPSTGVPVGLNFELARWHPTNPDVLYAFEPSTQRRQVWSLNVATKSYTLVHDFTSLMPIGGYPWGLSLSADGRYMSLFSSRKSGQGQDAGDFVVVLDQKTGTVYSMDFLAKTGWGNIHAMFLDKSGTYALIQAGSQTQNQPDTWVWNFYAGTLDTLLWNTADSPGGHKGLGFGEMVNPDYNGGQHRKRQLSTPHTTAPAIVWPSRNGKPNWQMDSHLSWNNLQSQFFFYSNYIASRITGWVLHSGNVYKRMYFTPNSLTQRAPEGLYHNGVSLTRAASTPSQAGQWSYDSTTDTIYVWLPGNANATNSSNVIVPFAWWPAMEEVVQVWIDDATNITKLRRLAHHQSHWPNTSGGGYMDTPRAASDLSGNFVMFDSNWGGSGHRDVFILKVQ